MNKNMKLFTMLFAIITATPVFAGGNAPIQRIDVANMLWNSNEVSQTTVQLIFKGADATACYNTTLTFGGVLTVFAGFQQQCGTLISSVSINPVISPAGLGIVYATPPDININSNLYSTQLLITQGVAPIFDPNNGSVLMPGTVQTSTVANLSEADLLSIDSKPNN